MTELRDLLQSSLGPSYTIERELGGGGMARVFVAREHALDRPVVLKALAEDVRATLSAERFKLEILLAARLQQANIVPLLSAGEAGGIPYYTMPLVEGDSLRTRLSQPTPVSLVQAISILRDLARALEYAHQHGVIHRDIKPENILLSGSTAMVTDFGIAKAVSAAQTDRPTLTRTGASVGTPAYMAPEQVAGDAVDHRVDLYAFGLVAWELLAGRHPFAGRQTAQQLMGAQLTEQPAPVADVRSDAPAVLAGLVERCLRKDPAERPGSAGEILTTLDAVATSTRSLTAVAARRRVRAVIGAGALLLAAAGYALLARRDTGDEVPSLAVLPFINIGGDSTLDYRADGITDALQTAIAGMPGVRMPPRTAAGRFRGQRDVDAREVGRVMAVGYVVRGTLRGAGGRLRVSAQLSRTSDGTELWSRDWDRELGDNFSVEDEITGAITTNLRLRFNATSPAAAAAAARGTTDSVAYDLYQRAQFLLRRRGPGVVLAVDYFRQAITRDSGFARAYSGLSDALSLLPNFLDTTFTGIYQPTVAAARKALALDSTLAEPHAALAVLYMSSFQWPEAEQEFRRAIVLDSSDAPTRMHYARLLVYTGRLAEAVAELRRAKVLDPTSAVISGWLAHTLLWTGQRSEAFAEIDRTLELDSLNPPMTVFGADVSLARGQRQRALSLVGRIPPGWGWVGSAARIYAAAGETTKARELLHRMETGGRSGLHESAIAVALVTLGDSGLALTHLERAMDAREFWPSVTIPVAPETDLIRNSTRFGVLLKRAGLDVERLTRPRGGRAQ